jgi:hypothetical protein
VAPLTSVADQLMIITVPFLLTVWALALGAAMLAAVVTAFVLPPDEV